MKKFLKKLTGFIPIVVFIIVINLVVDPANIYKKEYEKKAAKLLLDGKNIIGMTNYDERIFQKEIIKGEKDCPDTIILGSSRVMTLSNEVIFDMGNYRNHGVSGAGIYDYLGILGVYECCNKQPQKVIVGLDPWILNENNGDTRYLSLIRYINNFEEILQDKPENKIGKRLNYLKKEMQFLSVPYFQNSIKKLLKNPKIIFEIENKIDFYGTLDRESDNMIRYTDGSVEYGKKEREIEIGAVNDNAKAYVSGEIYQLENYDSLSNIYCTYLEGMVDYLQKKDIEVIFYLPPYHPYVFKKILKDKKYNCFFKAEEYFLNLAERKKIKIFGSYNPQLLGCEEGDFFDGMHMKRKNVGAAWKQYYAVSGDSSK